MKRECWIKRGTILLLASVMLTGAVTVQASEEAMSESTTEAEPKPMAVYDTEDGLVELVDFIIHGDELAVILDYTNTTDKNVSPVWQMEVNAFQNGIEMKSGRSFEIEGVRDNFTEIRPGTKLRVAEFFELETQDPVEVEISQVFSWDEKKPLYVTIDLSTKEVTSEGGEVLGKGGSIIGGIMDAATDMMMDEYKKAADEVMDEYKKAYDEAGEEYQKAFDQMQNEYEDTLNDLYGDLGF